VLDPQDLIRCSVGADQDQLLAWLQFIGVGANGGVLDYAPKADFAFPEQRRSLGDRMFEFLN
jgi:hypothetical protein